MYTLTNLAPNVLFFKAMVTFAQLFFCFGVSYLPLLLPEQNHTLNNINTEGDKMVFLEVLDEFYSHSPLWSNGLFQHILNRSCCTMSVPVLVHLTEIPTSPGCEP